MGLGRKNLWLTPFQPPIQGLIPQFDLKTRRTAEYKAKLAWFSLAVLFAMSFLLYAGGFTTSIGAGMVFADWPLSNGSLNPEGWLEDRAMLAEHSHRILGATMGLLILILTVWIWIEEKRAWMRNLAIAALALVVLQGLVGGMRVLFNSLQFAMVHGCLAPTVLCLVASIAAAQSPWWFRIRAFSADSIKRVKTGGLIVCGLIFVQIIVGAIMRHSGAGLAIPTFPLTPDGGIVPHAWNFGIAIHFAHRVIAVIIVAGYLVWAIGLILDRKINIRIRILGWLGIALLTSQVVIGAFIIWTLRSPVPTTVHVLVGAFLLATSWVITFFQFQPSRSVQVAVVPRAPADLGLAGVSSEKTKL